MEKYQKIVLLRYMNNQIWEMTKLALANRFPIRLKIDIDFESAYKDQEFWDIMTSVFSEDEETPLA